MVFLLDRESGALAPVPARSIRCALAGAVRMGLAARVAATVAFALGVFQASAQTPIEPPAAMEAPEVLESGLESVRVTWLDIATEGAPVTGYDLQYRRAGDVDWADGPRNRSGTRAEIAGLSADTDYEVRVRAVNAAGAGEWSGAAGGSTAFWTSTLRVGALFTSPNGYLGYQRRGQFFTFGSLTPHSFTYDDVAYDIFILAWYRGRRYGPAGLHTRALDFYIVEKALPTDWILRVDAAHFHIDDAHKHTFTSYPLHGRAEKYYWTDPGIKLVDGSRYEVALSRSSGDQGGTPAAGVPLTAAFENHPGAHDGSTPFAIELRFSEEVQASYRWFTDSVFSLTGGRVTGARRLSPPSTVAWVIDVVPDGAADVVLTLPGNRDCAETGAICTADGRTLAQPVQLTVPGPPERPVISSPTTFDVPEGGTAVAELTATDADTEASDLSWSIPSGAPGGADRGHFSITGAGALAFASAKDYENPDDADADGSYRVTVQVSDGENSASADLTIAISNRNETPTADAGPDQPGIKGGAVVTLTGAGTDPDAGDTLSYAWKQVSGTSVTLTGADTASPNFTAPSGLDADETLTFTLRVVDADGLFDDDSVAVTVDSVSHDPTLGTLSLSGIDIGTFSGAVTSYEASVANAVTATTVAATATHSAATVTIEPASPVALAEGANEIRVTVTAEDGSTTKTYTVTVTRASLPVVTIGAGATPVTEGTGASFTLTLDEAATEELTVAVSVQESGSVLSGTPPSSVPFAAGETTATLGVPTAADSVVEADSTVTATLAAGTGYGLGTAVSASVTVEDDDAASFAVSADPGTINEGESATLTVAISNGVTFAEDQAIALAASGTASASDHTGLPATLTLAAGSDAVTATLAAAADQEEEEAETVTVTASHRGAAVGSATVTIQSVSHDATLSALSLSGVDIGTFSSTMAAYTANVANSVTSTTVTATASHASATVSIEPGSEVTLAEGETAIAVTVTAEDGTTTKTYTVTVTRAGLPVVSVVAVEERVVGPIGTVTVSRTGPTGEPLEVRVVLSASDRTSLTEVTARFGRGERSVTKGVQIGDDNLVEDDITVTWTLREGAGYTVSAEQGSASVVVEESEVPAFTVSVNPAAIAEGESATVTVAIANRIRFRQDQTIDLSVSGTASGSDYSGVPATLMLAARTHSATATLTAAVDQEEEADETVTITASHGGSEIGSATVTIAADEPRPFTAQFAGMPAKHDGEAAFTFELRFSKQIEISYKTLRDTAFEVTGGSVRNARRLEPPSNLRWEITVQPSSDADVVLALPVAAGCAAEGAVCTPGGKALSKRVTARVKGPADEPQPFTAQFAGMPAKHDGEAAFTFELRFSKQIEISYKTLRDTAFEVTGGSVRNARRLEPPSNLRWEITVQPSSDADVVLALPVAADCAAEGAVCTPDGKALSKRVTGRVKGPAEVESAGFPLAPENSRPSGIWSDGETAWVADLDDARLYAYRRADGERQPTKDIVTDPAPMGLWSDGDTIWVAGLGGGLRAHRLADGRRQPRRDLALEANAAPAGVWSDGETGWVADWLGDTVHAYSLADGQRVAERDIRLAGGNLLPVGLWSDGETLWVADWRERVYAYRLSDGRRDPDRDIHAEAVDTDPSGLWAGDGLMLSTGWEGDRVRAYRMPALVSPGAGARKADGSRRLPRAAPLPPIADPALRAAIGAALHKAPGEAVSPQELAGLESLAARNGGIRDLAGLERAVGLKELDLGDNPLADLRPLASLPALESLNLDGSALELSQLAPLGSLRRLSIRRNLIEDLQALVPLAGLTELDVGDNRIEDLRPLAGLTRLAVLRADRNRIAELWPLASLAGLEVLDLGANRVRDLQPLAGMERLRALRLAGNGLTEIHPLAGLRGLANLGLAGNSVEDLRALSGLAGLRRLDLRGNALVDLRPLRGLPSLRWVHVGGSRIEDLAPLDGLRGLTVVGRDDRDSPSAAIDSIGEGPRQ